MTDRKEGAIRKHRVTATPEHVYERCTEEGECKLWDGATTSNGGFPIGYFNGKNRSVRPLLYAMLGCSVPPGCAVSVSCNNRLCLAEAHLFAKTLGKIRKDTYREILRGDPVTLNRIHSGPHIRGCAKANAEIAVEIRADPRPNPVISKERGMSTSAISRIKLRVSYKPAAVPNSVFNLAASLGVA